MSWSRLRFDDGAYLHRLAETVGPGEYMTQTPRICNDCAHYAPGVFLDRQAGSVAAGDERHLTDINSDLLGLTRRASECPSQKYLGSAATGKARPSLTGECRHPHDLTPEPTLLSNPKCTNKETTINRWEWLCRDPQADALVSFDHNISNRIVVKDNHRPCIEKPLDQSAALPPPCNKKSVTSWADAFVPSGPSADWPEAPALATCRTLSKINGGDPCAK